MATYPIQSDKFNETLQEIAKSLNTASVSAAASAAPHAGMGYDTNVTINGTAGQRSSTDAEIINKAQKYCCQTSLVIDHDTLWSSYQTEDEMKEQVKLRLKTAMVDNLIEKIAYTRIDNKHEHNITFNARCYVLTRDELIKLIKEFQ